jgi:hypothetical protein
MNQPIEKFRHFTKGKGNSSRTGLEGASLGALFEPNTSMGDQMMTETETSEWLLVATQQPTHKPAGGPI